MFQLKKFEIEKISMFRQYRHRYLQQMYESMAEVYKLQNKFRLPKSTMWIEQETVVDTPLEYPF